MLAVACTLMACALGPTPTPKAASVPTIAEERFADFMLDLQEKHKLLTMARYDSRRFTAISNAREELTREHLKHYEQLHDLFLDHFRRRGFKVSAPKERLMVAAFDTPAGFNAYFGQPLAPTVAGIYHPATNRLVIYDLGRNKDALALRDEGMKLSQAGKLTATSVERRWRDHMLDANLGTALHECAHQLAFNCGLLNRQGHNPLWLVEGMACYCEATDQGDRQIIGAPNRRRIETLAQAQGRYLPLEHLLREDDVLRSSRALLGYAQSWALFRMLMEQEPAKMREYLERIYPERTQLYRMEHFRAVFGDVYALEQRYRTYLGTLVSQQAKR